MTLFLRSLVVSLACLFATVSNAQETMPSAAGAPASVDQASEALIRLLEDPEGRRVLVEELRRLQAAQAQPAPAQTGPAQTGPATTPGSETAPQTPAGQPAEAPSGQPATAPSGQTPADAPQPAADAATGQPAAAGEAPAEEGPKNFAVQLGEYTKLLVDDATQVTSRLTHSLGGVVLLFNGELQIRWDKARIAFMEVAIVLLAALILFWTGQRILSFLLHRQAVKAKYGGWVIKMTILFLTTIADAFTVVVGWGAGYAAALLEFGDLEKGVSLLESLTLNAFLVVGLTKVGLRFVFAPARTELRLLPFTDTAASYWTSRLGFVVSLLGYGIMLGVPVSNLAISFVLGNAVRAVVVLGAAIFLLVLIHRKKENVSGGIRDYAEASLSGMGQRSMLTIARIWHWVANIYVLLVFGLWLSRPFDAVAIAMRATALSILTVMASTTLTLMMTKAITGGIRLPDGLRESLPALEGRLNAFIPRILKILRLVVFIVTVLLVLDIWNLINLVEWAQSEKGVAVIGRFSSAALVLLSAFVIWLAMMSWVDLKLREEAGYVVTARVRTLFQLFRNAFTVLIIVMGSLLALSEFGIDIGPLIAGAGVVGLAISFGAQTLVKDIITGAFIQIENAINEGDVVTVAGTTGVVERLTVRSVRLRDLDGTTHIVPFSSVDMVSNFMRDFSYHVAVIGVSYDTDIKLAKRAMEEAFERLKAHDLGASVIGDLEMHGVTSFGDSAVNIRARIKTTPGDQWGVGRAYNECVKEVFDEWGIEIPFPQVTYHEASNPTVTERSTKKQSRTHDEDGDGGSEGSSNSPVDTDMPESGQD
jgi:small-conductance mechanosensitive channel